MLSTQLVLVIIPIYVHGHSEEAYAWDLRCGDASYRASWIIVSAVQELQQTSYQILAVMTDIMIMSTCIPGMDS